MAAMNSHHSLTVSAVRYCMFLMKALPHFDGLCDSGRVNYVFCFMRGELRFFFSRVNQTMYPFSEITTNHENTLWPFGFLFD